MAIYSWFNHQKWWFSIAMFVYQRVNQWWGGGFKCCPFLLGAQSSNQPATEMWLDASWSHKKRDWSTKHDGEGLTFQQLNSVNNQFPIDRCFPFKADGWILADLQTPCSISQKISVMDLSGIWWYDRTWHISTPSNRTFLSLKHLNWLVVWNIFYFSIYIYILGIVTPTDFHIFQRGGSTTNQPCFSGFRRILGIPRWNVSLSTRRKQAQEQVPFP